MRGALLFAFNSADTDYVKMAEITAKRINYFLNIPCSLVTDQLITNPVFDKILYLASDSSNTKHNKVWLNKGRYNAFDLSPYDETLLIDTDYVVNSTQLTTVFDFYDDFCCHNLVSFLMYPNANQEQLGMYSMNILWATVMFFKKTNRMQQMFSAMKMVQHNYSHYRNLHGFTSGTFRNDYALTIANRIVNGHIDEPQDFIPWNLLHVGQHTKIASDDISNFNTTFKVTIDLPNKDRKEYIKIQDTDFHMLDKKNFMELFNE